MKETITNAILAVLTLVALVVLLTTPRRAPSGTASTAPGKAPADPAPVTEGETVPQTTAPADAMPLVEELLGHYPLDETALSHSVYDDTLHSAEDLTGAGKASPAHALARLSDDREMNPIAAFWLLAKEGLYEKTPEDTDKLAVPAMKTPETGKKEYPYTTEGVRDFLTDVLNLSAAMEDGLPLDIRALGEDGTVEQVHWEEQDCCYAYYVCYSPEAAHFLCFYLRGGETITDAEFQLLRLRYADGDQESLERIDQLGDRQIAALMTAAELLLTGESRAAEGRIPLGYTLGEYTVTIERFSIEGSGDTGTLTNYRIRK